MYWTGHLWREAGFKNFSESDKDWKCCSPSQLAGRWRSEPPRDTTSHPRGRVFSETATRKNNRNGKTGHCPLCGWDCGGAWRGTGPFLRQFLVELPPDLAFPLQGIHLKELKAGILTAHLYTSVYGSTSHRSQKLESTFISINRGNQMWSVHTGAYYPLIKKEKFGRCCHREETYSTGTNRHAPTS